MHSLSDALLAFQAAPTHHAELFRLLVQHPIWFVPARDGQPLLQQREDETHLHIYSKKSHLQGHNHDEIGSLEFTSKWLFDNLPPVQSIIIDGHTQHALQIPSTLFASLIQMNKAHQLEHLLANQSKNNGFMNALKAHSSYYLPLVQDASGQNHVALAPDHQQRALVAVFTAEDAAQRFVEAASDKLDNLQMDVLDGDKLYHHLSQLPLDGMVINCYGPTAPIAINKSTISALASFNRM